MSQAADTDPFLEADRIVYGILYALFLENGSAVKTDVLASISGNYDPRRLEEVLGANLPRMQRLFSREVEQSVRETLEKTMRLGFLDAVYSIAPADRVSNRSVSSVTYNLNESPSAKRVLESSVASLGYYVNRYYPETLLPSLRNSLAQIVSATSVTDVVDAAKVAVAVDKAFTVKGYWQILSSAAVSRVYHYGYLKTAQLNGKRAYRWHTVVDSSTSDVCLGLHGQEFWIADAVNMLESVAMTDDPEAATKLMPWRTPADVGGADAANLRLAGVSVPPAHPHCRSTLVTV